QYLLLHTQTGDAIWREDGARILLETNRRPGSRYPLTFLFTNHDTAPLEYGGAILRDFEITRPKYIVLFTNFESWLDHKSSFYTELRRRPLRRQNYLTAWHGIGDYVREHYEAEAR